MILMDKNTCHPSSSSSLSSSPPLSSETLSSQNLYFFSVFFLIFYFFFSLDWFGMTLPMEGVKSTSIVYKDLESVRSEPYALFCAEDNNGCHLEMYPRPNGEVGLIFLFSRFHTKSLTNRPYVLTLSFFPSFTFLIHLHPCPSKSVLGYFISFLPISHHDQ